MTTPAVVVMCRHGHRLVNGAEYLFSARDDTEVSAWVSTINSAVGETSPLLTPTVRQATPTLRQTTSANPLTSGPAAGEAHTHTPEEVQHGDLLRDSINALKSSFSPLFPL